MKQPAEYVETLKHILRFPIVNTFGRSTVERLVGHIDAQDKEIDRLIDNVEQLKREAMQANEAAAKLKQLLDSEREDKRVELPRSVAEALTAVLSASSDNASITLLSMPVLSASSDNASILYNCFQIKQHTSTGEIIRDYAADNFDIFLAALVNGYTTAAPEPTTEQRIYEKLTSELVEADVQCPMPLGEFAKKLTLAVREVLAEERLKEVTTN